MKLKDAGIYDLINIFKGQPTNVHGLSQGGIINNIPRLINIPAYQRPYRWTQENITRLFEDFDENEEEYFLGSAVVVEKKKADGTIEFDVVDGQQRITTLYLLNYVRYLLRKEYTLEKLKKPFQPRASEFCMRLEECYVHLIGKNNEPFKAIQKKIEELMEDENLDPNERVEQLVKCYKENLCIPEEKSTSQETLTERSKKAIEFFEGEQLCLKYSRSRYDSFLQNALCNVYLRKIPDTTNFSLTTIFNIEEDKFQKNYIDALKKIFDEIWKRALEKKLGTDGITEICEKAIAIADNMIKNMSLCIVLTENENDANKLFEVLNDRALAVEDLELIKNHFYKEYCTKSNDSDEQKDSNITKLEELWTDKIFGGNGDFKNKLISYLGAIYLTCDKELAYKADAKLKEKIERHYSTKYFPIGGAEYKYEDILTDFNVYYAIKIILDVFGVKAQKVLEVSLRAEQSDCSITYKAIHLLNAFKYHAVMPALINVIISTYAQSHSLICPLFERDFKNYIENLIKDKNHTNSEYEKIHRCAYMLWVATIKGKDYEVPREIAKRVISKYGRRNYSSDFMDFQGQEISNLNNQLDKWLSDWVFDNNKTFAIKVLLLNLLHTRRLTTEAGYKASEVKLNIDIIFAYRQDAGRLHLDHLEAKTIIPGAESSYYLADDKEKRQKDVNGYIGNFMILDAQDNNQKNNYPMITAMGYYEKLKDCWLVKDINDMMSDPLYFDMEKNIPKEAFFKERSKRLKKYFVAFLNRDFSQNEIIINF